jgi:hypothetical protein
MGFEVRELPFEFSALPGRFATPLFGAAVSAIVGVAGHWGAAGQRFAPLLVAGIGAITLVIAGRWVARYGVLAVPLLRERGVNLEAKRPNAEPGLWLCAHLDTKSQPMPTLVRVVGIGLAALGYAATLALAIVAMLGTSAHPFFWAAAALVTLVGAVPVVLSVVGSNSPGALDNASGVTTVLEAARQLEGREVGVLVTDAEELGLAGARAWPLTTAVRADAVILNCDGVDDQGDNVVMYAGRPPRALLDGVMGAAATTGVPCRARRLALGVLTDSVAFGYAGFPSVTFSRGTFASLARVHSKRDDLHRLHGTGIAPVAKLIAATANQVGSRGKR